MLDHRFYALTINENKIVVEVSPSQLLLLFCFLNLLGVLSLDATLRKFCQRMLVFGKSELFLSKYAGGQCFVFSKVRLGH